jgi:hypothetical protein
MRQPRRPGKGFPNLLEPCRGASLRGRANTPPQGPIDPPKGSLSLPNFTISRAGRPADREGFPDRSPGLNTGRLSRQILDPSEEPGRLQRGHPKTDCKVMRLSVGRARGIRRPPRRAAGSPHSSDSAHKPGRVARRSSGPSRLSEPCLHTRPRRFPGAHAPPDLCSSLNLHERVMLRPPAHKARLSQLPGSAPIPAAAPGCSPEAPPHPARSCVRSEAVSTAGLTAPAGETLPPPGTRGNTCSTRGTPRWKLQRSATVAPESDRAGATTLSVPSTVSGSLHCPRPRTTRPRWTAPEPHPPPSEEIVQVPGPRRLGPGPRLHPVPLQHPH